MRSRPDQRRASAGRRGRAERRARSPAPDCRAAAAPRRRAQGKRRQNAPRSHRPGMAAWPPPHSRATAARCGTPCAAASPASASSASGLRRKAWQRAPPVRPPPSGPRPRQGLRHPRRIAARQRRIKRLQRRHPVPDPARGRRLAFGVKPQQHGSARWSPPRVSRSAASICAFQPAVSRSSAWAKAMRQGVGRQRLADRLEHPPDQRRDRVGRGRHRLALVKVGVEEPRQQRVLVGGHLTQRLRRAQRQRGRVPVARPRQAEDPRGKRRRQICGVARIIAQARSSAPVSSATSKAAAEQLRRRSPPPHRSAPPPVPAPPAPAACRSAPAAARPGPPASTGAVGLGQQQRQEQRRSAGSVVDPRCAISATISRVRPSPPQVARQARDRRRRSAPPHPATGHPAPWSRPSRAGRRRPVTGGSSGTAARRRPGAAAGVATDCDSQSMADSGPRPSWAAAWPARQAQRQARRRAGLVRIQHHRLLHRRSAPGVRSPR